LALLALTVQAVAFAPAGLPLRQSRSPAVSGMRMQKVDLLDKVEELQVLTAVSNAGLLSKVEQSGLLSTLEKQGALSTVEKLLPLADDLGLISTTEKLINISPGTLNAGGLAALAAAAGIVAAVPDDSAAAVVGQGAGVVALAAVAVPLFVGAKINSIIQSNEPLQL